MRAARDEILASCGQVDILFNGAGGNVARARNDTTPIFEVPLDAFDEVLRLNLHGTLIPSLVFGESMAARGSGSIINVSSMAATQHLSGVLGYSVAKAGIDNLTKWLAVEMARKHSGGVRVNAIAPGFFVSEQNRHVLVKPDGSPTDRARTIIGKDADGSVRQSRGVGRRGPLVVERRGVVRHRRDHSDRRRFQRVQRSLKRWAQRRGSAERHASSIRRASGRRLGISMDDSRAALRGDDDQLSRSPGVRHSRAVAAARSGVERGGLRQHGLVVQPGVRHRHAGHGPRARSDRNAAGFRVRASLRGASPPWATRSRDRRRDFLWRARLLGLGESGNFPASIKTVSEWFPKSERALAVGIFNAGQQRRRGARADLVPWHRAARGVGEWAFIATGAIGFIWLIFWLAIYREPAKHPKVSPAELEFIRGDRVGRGAANSVDAAAALSADVGVSDRQGAHRSGVALLSVLASRSFSTRAGA